jgi:hypothetical protein
VEKQISALLLISKRENSHRAPRPHAILSSQRDLLHVEAHTILSPLLLFSLSPTSVKRDGIMESSIEEAKWQQR